MKSFPRQSRSRGGGIAIVYKSTLGSNITFKTNFDFTHTSFEVVQASITLQHNTLHFFCLYRPPPNRRNNLTDSMFTEQLPDLDLTMTSIKNILLQTHLNQTIIALNPTSMFQSLSLLPHTGLLGTLLKLTSHHLLLNFPVFHLLKMQTSSVTFCAL